MRDVFVRARLIAPLFAVLIFIGVVSGQKTTADIAGTVVDSAGKVIAGANVTATHIGTGSSRNAVTDANGSFRIPNLQPGRYDVAVEAPNFSKSILKGVELNVGVDLTPTIELKPGQITEVVEVTGEAALVQTTRSDIDTTVSPKEIENLPLLNRTFAGLTIIAPEARPVANFDPTKTRVGTIAFNGGDGRQVT